MSRRLERFLLVFGLAIVFGVGAINEGDVYAYAELDKSLEGVEIDKGLEKKCFEVYYRTNKSDSGKATNSVCKDNNGGLYADTIYASLPKFTVDDRKICFVLPGKKLDSACSELSESEELNTDFLLSVVQKEKDCDTTGSTMLCSYKGSEKTYEYYVNGDSEPVNKPIPSGGSGTTTDSEGYSGDSGKLDDDPGEDNNDPNCVNSGAAQSLGWIVCPVLNLLSNAADTVYTDYVEPALRVEPTLFSQSEGDATGQAWRIFQGLANTLFIILILIIIFSQLTGIGIDNYGIKKILPKLIVAAVLINLSYLICLISIDLSNIVGNGIQSLFNGLPTGEPTTVNIVEGGTVNLSEVRSDAYGATVLTGVVLLVAVATQIWSAVTTAGVLGGIILPLLVAAISVVIAIFFLFLLLATRQAAIVALTVISPLAFACYMLPNTKKLFDKWLKLGWALLLVYPICGLLVGGGNYVSRLLLSAGAGSGGFAMAFMAMVVGIVPIFFVPSVLKSSLAAAGNIGAKISSIGSRVRGGAVKGVKGNELYKMAQARGRENATRRFAGVKQNADGTYSEKSLGKIGTLMRGGSKKVSASRAQFLIDQEKRRKEQNLMGTGFETGLAGIESKVDEQRDANAEAMLSYGRATFINDKNQVETVNSGDEKAVGRYHAAALKKYHEANEKGDERARSEALSEIKAAQKMLSKTGNGRGLIQNNLVDAIANGYSSGTNAAALHLQGNFGELYKTKNRGADKLINDLASGREIESIAGDISSGMYELAGAEKYDQTTLVGADDSALRGMVNAVNTINQRIASGENVSDIERERVGQIQGTARKALEMYKQGRISIKPEVLKQVKAIAGDSSPSGDSGSSGGGGLTEPPTPIADSGRSGDLGDGGELRVRDIRERLSSGSRDSLSGGSSGRGGGTPPDYAPGDPSSAGGE